VDDGPRVAEREKHETSKRQETGGRPCNGDGRLYGRSRRQSNKSDYRPQQLSDYILVAAVIGVLGAPHTDVAGYRAIYRAHAPPRSSVGTRNPTG